MSAGRLWTRSPASAAAGGAAEPRLGRRAVLGALAGAGAVLALPGAGAASLWPIWWSWKFEAMPSLDGCGLSFLRTLPPIYMFPKDSDRKEPDLDFVRRHAVEEIRERGHERVVLNIEHWDEVTEIDKYVAVARVVKEALPTVRIGYYSIVPNREYYALQEDFGPKLEAWEEKNAHLRKLADAVDDIYPSLYTFFPDVEGWKRYATKMIAAARTYGKPVYPYLWMQYHDSNRREGRQIIDGAFWRTQLELVRAQADGVVIWGTLALRERRPGETDRPRLRWDPDAPWWRETKAFAAAQGYDTRGCQDR